MVRLLGRFFLVPALICALIVVPTVAFSMASGSGTANSLAKAAQSPLPTPTKPGTVPLPSATPTHQPWPTATPTSLPVAATATPTATLASRYTDLAMIDGAPMRNVIGNPLSNTLYGYTFDQRLYRSEDGGVSWQLVTTQPAMTDFVMSPADPAILYSGRGNPCDGAPQPPQPLYLSTDGGVNWRMLPSGADLRPLLLDPDDAQHIFAATCAMIFLSKDGGVSWVAKAGAGSEQLWQTYHAISMASGAPPADAPPADAPPTDAKTPTQAWDQLFVGGIAADGSGVVVFSNDMGESWVRLTPNVFPSPWGLNALAADRVTQGLLAFAEPHSVWQTSNFGVDWQVTTKGLETVVERRLAGGVFGLNDLVLHPNGQLYLATVRGLYAKEFAATTWNKIAGASYDNLSISQIVYTRQRPDLLWLNTPEGVYLYWVTL